MDPKHNVLAQVWDLVSFEPWHAKRATFCPCALRNRGTFNSADLLLPRVASHLKHITDVGHKRSYLLLLGRKGVEDGFFSKLGELAKPDGVPSDEAMEKLAEEFLIGKANAYGTASFYDFLKPENKGKYNIR